ncbi:MAG: hypothetical protein BWK77_00375 [Verrucomicrobia bacterium A1]|nr:MAG: hypothetical protein BWK77_00375 [Verrucomicrobia bacterium A1]
MDDMSRAYPAIPDGQMEKYSSASTLSDMEIFIFPELLYALVLANLMSPAIWAWREDPWFARIDRMTPYRRILRLKQFVMDHYEFNLDLDTWGLTTQERELARFRPFMDEATLSRSNALFGYEGDKYYFDMDIRRHFGLDKYGREVIPYWKTETVEAMDAFRFKEGYASGAGECVSLSTLYAAALHVVCGIPLDDIFLMGTPLHSQNFVFAGDGVLTNNRRLVTKSMWFNGTELTRKAQRALRHEQVTVIAHRTGWIHCVYPGATIAPQAYARLSEGLHAFLRTDITLEILLNFLRDSPERQACFQVRHERHGRLLHIAAEKVYHYEHGSPYKVSDATREKLLAEIDEDEFFAAPLEGRVVLDDLEPFFRNRRVDPADEASVRRLMEEVPCHRFQARHAIGEMIDFACLKPNLPDAPSAPRRFVPGPAIDLDPGLAREEVRARLEAQRAGNPVVDLAFYALRDLSRTDWAPFLKAAMERSPVSVKGAADLDDAALEARLRGWPDASIYDGARCAQPDEVWNYRRGDGLEKALCLACVLKARHPAAAMELRVQPDQVVLSVAGREIPWSSAKGLRGVAAL